MSPTQRKRLLFISGIAMVAFNVALFVLDKRLEATGGPSILGLEFSGSLGRVEEIQAGWGGHGEYLARLSLWIDFGFMASYGTFFALACAAVRDFSARRGLTRLAAVGVVTPLCAASATVFDLVENTLWLLVLGGHLEEPAPLVATACASLKFLLIAVAIVYSLVGLVTWLRRR